MSDLSGTVFARLTVRRRSEPRWTDQGSYIYYDCECVCGAAVPHVRVDRLRRGGTKSCGCLRGDVTRARFAARREAAGG